MRLRVLALSACLVALLLSPVATAQDGCSGVRADGAWTTVAAPELPQRPVDTTRALRPGSTRELQISAYAVDRERPDRLYVTNGVGVLRSSDGGCTWETVFVLPALPSAELAVTAQDGVVVDVRVPVGGGGRVHLLVQAGGSGRPYVLTSRDGRTPFRVTDSGLPPTAAPCTPATGPAECRLHSAPSDPDRLYLSLTGPVTLRQNGRLLVSDDAGATWSPRPNPDPGQEQAVVPDTTYEQLAVDPVDADRLWVLVSEILWRSSDAGRSWVRLDARDGVRDLSLLDVAGRPGSPTRVRTFQPGAFGGDPGLLESRDGGEVFALRPALDLLGGLTSVAHGSDSDELVVTTENDPERNVYAYVAARDLWAPVNTLGARGAGLTDVQATAGTAPDYWFRGPQGLARLDLDALGGVEVVLPEPPPRIDVPPLLPPLPATLSPSDATVDLALGETRDLRYELDLPPRPTPLDVFFLVDSSASMGDDLRALADGTADIVRALAARRIDLRVGLGDFRSTQVRYRRLHQLDVPNEQFVRTLYALDTGGGDETHYTALHQMATGSGVAPVAQGRPVRPGQQADFRPGALRFVVHVTDELLQPDESGPTPLAAQTALVERGIRHIGLAADVQDVNDAVRDASGIRQQMRVLSAATGAVAPPGGVDCDGDGTRELPAGEPLVCSVPESGGHPDLATPIIDILTSLVDRAPVGLQVDAGGREVADAARPLQPVDAVDVTEPQSLAFSLAVRCTPALAGQALPVRLTATVRAAPVTGTALTVRCAVPAAVAAAPAAPAAPDVPPAASGAEPRPALVPPPLPVPPPLIVVPAPAPAAAGAGAGSSVTAAVGQPGAQAAVGEQEESQAQVASALADSERAPDSDLAFSLRLAGAALLTAGTAWGVRRQRALHPSRIR